MENSKKGFTPLLIIIIVVAIIGGGILVAKTTGVLDCYSSTIDRHIEHSVPVFSADGSKIAFVVKDRSFKQPVGICTFPDGGTAKLVYGEFRVYTLSRDGGEPKLEATFPYDPPKNVVGATNNSGYLGNSMSEQVIAFDATSMTIGIYNQVKYVKVNFNDKTITNLEDFSAPSSGMPYTPDPHNKSITVKYDLKTGIGIYNNQGLQKIIVPKEFFEENNQKRF